MRWKTKLAPPRQLGDIRTLKKFAWLSVTCKDGYKVWLGFYYIKEQYTKWMGRLPLIRGMTCTPPVIEMTGWKEIGVFSTKECNDGAE